MVQQRVGQRFGGGVKRALVDTQRVLQPRVRQRFARCEQYRFERTAQFLDVGLCIGQC